MIEIKSYIPVLSFPNNVVVVASPTGRAPPEEPGEWRVNSLSRALRMPRNIQKMFDDFGDGIAPYLLEWGSTSTSTMTECSILVHEGTYFLNSDFLEDIDGKFGKLNVEVVGVQNVRIIVMGDEKLIGRSFKCRGDINITFKNVSIYSRTLGKNCLPLFHVGKSATVSLHNVRINAPEKICIQVSGKEGEPLNPESPCIILEDVCILQCLQFVIISDAQAFLNRCKIRSVKDSNKLRRSRMELDQVDIEYNSMGLDISVSEVIIKDCEFSGLMDRTVAIDGTSCALDVSNSIFKHSSIGLACQRRRSIVRVNDCVFHRSVTKAFATALNCKLTVTNCNIQTQWLMELRTNKDGEIKFNRNKVIRMPLILKDEMSKLPIHDFSRVEINVANLKSKSNFTTCASASASHKKLVAKYMQGGISYAPKDIHKVCFYCHLNQVTKDFLWCSKCKSTCYCSKDCQAKDWPDHKLNCKPFINRS